MNVIISKKQNGDGIAMITPQSRHDSGLRECRVK